MDAVEGAENIRFTKENVDLNVDDAVKGNVVNKPRGH